MKDFDILSSQTDIFGKRLLEASAGTGKTFAIEHLFLRLLLEQDETESIGVDQILVVTFTKAATRELKFRIRSNIEKALSYLKNNDGTKNPFFSYLDDNISRKKENIKKLQVALQLFEKAQIFTIHSFCYSMLAKYAFEAGCSFDLKEDESYIELFKREIVDYLRYFIDKKNYFPEQVASILKKYRDVSLLVEKIESYSPKKEKTFSMNSILKEFNEQLSDQIKRIGLFSCGSINCLSSVASASKAENIFFPSYSKNKVGTSSESHARDQEGEVNNDNCISLKREGEFLFSKKIFEDFEKEKKYYKKLKNVEEKELIYQLGILIDLVKEGSCSIESFDKILKTKFSLLDFFHESNLKKNVSGLTDEKLNYPGLLAKFGLAFSPLIQKALDEDRILNNLAFDIHEKAKKKLFEEDLFTFDDILVKMEEALDHPEFKKRVKNNFRAAVIDEFQDTDPIQWSIFKKLFFSDNFDLRAFYLVGDPKQSIYSFRNADLKTYFSASQFLGDGSKYYLGTNYRSSPTLISSLNYLFSQDFISDWMNQDEINSSLPFLPVKAGVVEEEAFLDEHRAVFFIAKDSSSKVKRWPSNNLENSTLFPYISKEIKRLFLEQEIKLEKIAVLVKDRYQAQSLKRYLLKEGLSASSSSRAPIAQTAAFQAMEEILFAVINCHDLNKIRIAIAGPYVRWVDSDIKEKKIDSCVKLFANLHEILKKEGLSLFFKSFLETQFSSDGETVLEKIIDRTDLSFYQNTMQIIEIFIEKEREQKLTSEGILNLFCLLKETDPEGNEKLIAYPAQEKSSVQIMTIHMSKGLEFDVVFALGVASRQWLDEENEEENSEKFRQLYVALTRAKKKLYVPIILDEYEQGYDPEFFSAIELFFSHALKGEQGLKSESILKKIELLKEKGIIQVELISPTEEISPLPIQNEIFQLEYSPPEILSLPKGSFFSFSSLVTKPKITFPIEERGKKEILFCAKDFPPGADIGILIHEIMEKIFRPKQRIKELNAKYLDEVINEVVSFTIYAGKEKILSEIIKKTLLKTLTDDGFSLNDVPLENIFVESEFIFSFKDQNNFMKGFVDLIFCYQNKYYLVDWKTNWLGDDYGLYSKEKLKMTMEEHEYFLQAAIYSEALKRYLKIIDSRPFDEIFGGAIYLFLRGISDEKSLGSGVYHFIPDLSLIDQKKG